MTNIDELVPQIAKNTEQTLAKLYTAVHTFALGDTVRLMDGVEGYYPKAHGFDIVLGVSEFLNEDWMQLVNKYPNDFRIVKRYDGKFPVGSIVRICPQYCGTSPTHLFDSICATLNYEVGTSIIEGAHGSLKTVLGWVMKYPHAFEEVNTDKVETHVQEPYAQPKYKVKPHVHAELIKIWADDPSIEFEYLTSQNKWTAITTPLWHTDTYYRVKEYPKTSFTPTELYSMHKHLTLTDLANEVIKQYIKDNK